ncbi:hypothetical protein LX32DRAFT_635453 [Colletotrichum zoysiae]|uniref:Uncharacterized protein n=1 Tax=Colletotrichum zoysiae TaxID=1216348 RepID=A0AAD9M8C4_9PEZI|nr:hypothetical protein LX32DRAFT_635453 [Colletotrichum zoysiae]
MYACRPAASVNAGGVDPAGLSFRLTHVQPQPQLHESLERQAQRRNWEKKQQLHLRLHVKNPPFQPAFPSSKSKRVSVVQERKKREDEKKKREKRKKEKKLPLHYPSIKFSPLSIGFP